MRRTRHVALPVKAWQYVGLLIVSLACLTLGLISRDKEGHAGSLAGPELKHQAPHEVDACPNINPFTTVPSYSNLDEDQTRNSRISVGTATNRVNLLPDNLRISRSRSLDRSSQSRLRSRLDSRIANRLIDREATGYSRLGTRSQESLRRSTDPNRLFRSSNLDARFITRSLDRRSRSTERSSVVNQRENREALAHRISEQRERSIDRSDVRNRRSDSRERRLSTPNRETRREDRREIRERRAQSLDRREPDFERRVNLKQETIREDRRRNLVNRMDRRAEDRRSFARSLTRNLHQIRSSSEDRRNVRLVLDERRNSIATRDQDRQSVQRIDVSKNSDSRSRALERTPTNSRNTRQYSQSLDHRNARMENNISGRRLSKRSISLEERSERNTLNSRERSISLRSSNSRRERIDRCVRTTGSCNRLQSSTRRDSRLDLDRNSVVRSERRDGNNERRERTGRLDRRLDSRSNERRESSLARSLEQFRLDNMERRERMDRLSRNRLARSSESVNRDLDRRVRNLSSDRRTEGRIPLDTKRPSERQSNSNVRNQQEIKTDRSRTNDLERRERMTRFNLARRVRESRDRVARVSENRADRSRINDLERQEEPRRLMLARRTRSDSSRTPEAIKRDLERRVRDLSTDRRSDRRIIESRTLEHRNCQEIRTDRSRINNLERREEPRRLMLARQTRSDSSRTPEAIKRDLERRVRDLSTDRRSDRRIIESRTLEHRNRQEIRSDRSRINNLERREEPRRLMLARQTRSDSSRTPEAIKRDLERRVRDLSTDRRSDRRIIESRTLEHRNRQEIRTDRSRINNLKRREEPRRLMLARQTRSDSSRTPEAIKRDLERRVRDLSTDRRSDRRIIESRTLEHRNRQEIRTDRSRINNLERREEPRRLMLARQTRSDSSRAPEAIKRDLERRVRDLSTDRRSDRRIIESRTLEHRNRQEIRTDRSRINNLERREEPRRLMLARQTRSDSSRTPEAIKRDLERRVRDLSTDRRSDRRIIESRTLEHRNRQEIRTDRSRINNLERREEPRRLMLARQTRSDSSRTPEAIKRDLERRVRDLSTDRRSDRRIIESRTLEHRNRQEIRTDRSRINNLERREEPRRLMLARQTRSDSSRAPEAIKRDLERRVRDLSTDRRSDRRIIESRTLEHRNRQEIRTDRSRINNLERREEPRRLMLARQTRSDSSRTPEAIKRDLERRVRDLSTDRRSEHRDIVESRRSSERKSNDNNISRREMRTDRRLERRTLANSRRFTRSLDSLERREIKTDRRLSEQSTLKMERRERTERLNLARELRVLTRMSESSERDLDFRRVSRSSDSANRQEDRSDRRLSEVFNRNLDSRQHLQRRISVSRLQRTDDLSNNIQQRQRLISSRKSLNDVARSRLLDLNNFRDSRKDSADSHRQLVKSSRDMRISNRMSDRFDDNSSRLKISSGLSTLKAYLTKNDMTLEIIRQAIVIGLCAIYGLSIFHGKQSFISNFGRQVPRFILW